MTTLNKLTFADIRVPADMPFRDISSEESREYRFPGDERVVIRSPIAANVSTNGHRIIDAFGITHYIPRGWLEIVWTARDGENHVSF